MFGYITTIFTILGITTILLILSLIGIVIIDTIRELTDKENNDDI